MTVLVTGVGFIGGYVVRDLIKAGEKVVVYGFLGGSGSSDSNIPELDYIDSLVGGDVRDKIDVVIGDISDLGALTEAAERHSATSIVHFASMLSASAQANPRLSTQINVMGAANAFEAAARLEMEKVVWMSSSSVFGAGSVPASGVVDDHCVPDPEWTYGAAKLMGEKLAVAYADKYGINITGVRPTRVYGFGEHVKLARGGASSWLSNLLYKPAVGNEHCVVPFGRRELNFLYVEDVSDGVLKALQYREPQGADSYLFSGDHRLISDAHALVTSVLPEANCELSMDDLELANGAAWAFTMDADSRRATEQFGFTARHSMEEGVLKTLNGNRATVGLPPLSTPVPSAADLTAGSRTF